MTEQLQRNPTWLSVVAAAIVDGEGRLLLRKRPAEKHHGGLWEFPGGKVESGETPAIALVREIEEELSLLLDSSALEPRCFGEQAAEQGHPPIVILLYTVRSWKGEPHANDGAQFGWFMPEDAAQLPMPPVDCALLDQLRRMAA
jgi:8-oxo-dGTP diphosphatase